MKGERILFADDLSIAHEGFALVIDAYGRDNDQQIVGSASSVSEVEKLLKDGLKPTVAFVGNSFPRRGGGEQAAGLIRKFSPDTIIVSLSADDGVEWGDYNLLKNYTGAELADFLANLQH